MEIMLNDLSLEGQFSDIVSFNVSIDVLMAMRTISNRYGRKLYCHRNTVNAQVTRDMPLQQAVNHLEMNRKRALMQWLTKSGPFWEDAQFHSPDDYLECKDHIVTDTSIGEAAIRCYMGADCHLISIVPSSWEYSPITVHWHREREDNLDINVPNYNTAEDLEEILRSAPSEINSWEQLESECQNRFSKISFSQNAFHPLIGFPFSPSVARRICERLDILDRFKDSHDQAGGRNPEGHRLYQDHFTGDRAWFSDSSADEKNRFKTELTFKHPEDQDQSLFCPWHGKINNPRIRIHFSWPVNCDSPLYIVYIGPKITKQ